MVYKYIPETDEFHTIFLDCAKGVNIVFLCGENRARKEIEPQTATASAPLWL